MRLKGNKMYNQKIKKIITLIKKKKFMPVIELFLNKITGSKLSFLIKFSRFFVLRCKVWCDNKPSTR